ncbi:MAG: PA2779 family protein [Bdellovibrionales bacterium]|nr:PA2779 family protein [Bdellovibrionales bacterium]
MHILQRLKTTVLMVLIVMLTRVPQLVAADRAIEVSSPMISTTEWVTEQTREQMAQKVTQFLQKDEVRHQLAASGVSVDEASQRVASLSESELRQLSSEIDQAQYGGDVGGILIVVLLVVLIIFLVKRI